MRNKLLIAGGSDGYKLIPYEEFADADIWGVNDYALKLDRCDAIFELHTLPIIQKNDRTKDYYQKLKKSKIPIYMQKTYTAIPASVKYPFSEMVKKYGRKFFSTIDYMLVLAIDRGYSEIHLYGVDLAIYDEYLYQRPSTLYWIGYARGNGIDVVIQKESGINLSGAYAYESTTQQSLLELMNQVYAIKAQVKKIDEDIAYTDGVMAAVDNLIKSPDLDLKAAFNSGIQSHMKVAGIKSKLEKQLESLLLEISDITGHSVIIPEREIEIKK